MPVPFSAKEAVAPEVTTGASLAPWIVTVRVVVLVAPAASTTV